MRDETLQQIYDNVVNGAQKVTVQLVQSALDQGIEPITILNEGMVAAMTHVGKLFEEGEFYVPEMLIAARAMQAGMGILKPRLVQADYKPVGRVLIGTVKGDLHDIGKNLVTMMLEGAAFEVVDLGTDVSPEEFVESAKTSGANVVAMSALLTTTMTNMRTTVEALKNAGVRDKVKVIIGGAPVTENFAREIGADGFAPDASRGVAVTKDLIGA